MGRWSKAEEGKLRMALERRNAENVYALARFLHKELPKRSVTAITHKLREIISNNEFQDDSVEIGGHVFPAQCVSGYIILMFPDGTKEPAHHYVWKLYNNSEIPVGYHIHHIDGRRTNNDPDNLALMDATDHLSLHFSHKPPETFALFSFLQEKGLWNEYLDYRDAILTSFPLPD